MAHSFFRTQHRITQNLSAWHSVCSVDSVWNTTHKIFHTQHRITQNLLRMAFCVFRGFCVKHYTQDFSHTEAQNYTEFTPHGILCVPWFLCETLNSRAFAHSTEFHRNLLRMAFCVFRGSVWKERNTRRSVSNMDSVWNTTHKIFRTQTAQNFTEIYSPLSYSTPHGARAKRLAVLCVPWILCETRNNLLWVTWILCETEYTCRIQRALITPSFSRNTATS